jgi:hypothetical protein
MTRRIVTIVEGHSEAGSIPAFLRRVLQDRRIFDVAPDTKSIREHRQRLTKPDVFINRVRMAELRDDCAAVLVVFDADDDAACELGPNLRKLVAGRGITTPTCVVLAVREIESWLIAGVESLRGYRGVPTDLSPPENVETIRGAKEWLDRHMKGGYKETIDQLPLLLKLDYEGARTRASSLDKFLRDVESLASRQV